MYNVALIHKNLGNAKVSGQKSVCRALPSQPMDLKYKNHKKTYQEAITKKRLTFGAFFPGDPAAPVNLPVTSKWPRLTLYNLPSRNKPYTLILVYKVKT